MLVKFNEDLLEFILFGAPDFLLPSKVYDLLDAPFDASGSLCLQGQVLVAHFANVKLR